MVNGLVLQVRTYCAQYNIRKTTTNGSTIGKEKTTPFVIRNFTRHAKPTMVYSTADTYGRIGASMYNIIKRFEGSKYGRRPNSSNKYGSILVPGFVRRRTARVGDRGDEKQGCETGM